MRIRRHDRTNRTIWWVLKGLGIGLAAYAFFSNYRDLHRYIKIRNM